MIIGGTFPVRFVPKPAFNLVFSTQNLLVPADSSGAVAEAWSGQVKVQMMAGGKMAVITSVTFPSLPSIYVTPTVHVGSSGATITVPLAKGLPAAYYEGSITVEVTALLSDETYTLQGAIALAANKQGAQGIQGLDGRVLRNRGQYTQSSLQASTETFYNNDSWVDYLTYPTTASGATQRKYRLADDITEWTKTGYTKADGTTVSGYYAPNLNGTSSSVWVVFSNISDLAANFLISDSFASQTASIVQAFIGEGGTRNEDGSISVSNTANGWAIKAGEIWHTKSGMKLTSDGTISDPDGLHLVVGGKSIVKGNELAWGGFPNGPFPTVASSYKVSYEDSVGTWKPYGEKILYLQNTTSGSASSVGLQTSSRIRLRKNTTYTLTFWFMHGGSSVFTLHSQVRCYDAQTGGTATGTSGQVTVASATAVQSLSLTFSTADKAWMEVILALTTLPASNTLGFLGASLVEGSSAPTEWMSPTTYIGDEATFENEDLKKDLLQTGIDIKERKITLTADMFECQNNQGEKTAYLDELGNFTTAGIQTQLRQVVDSVDKFLDLFVPCPVQPSNHQPWMNPDDPQQSGYVRENDYDEAFHIGDISQSRMTLAASPMSKSNVPVLGAGNQYVKFFCSLDMRAAGGLIELAWVPTWAIGTNGESLPVSSSDLGANCFMGIFLPFLTVTGLESSVWATEFCRTPTKMSTGEAHFVSMNEMKSLVGKKIAIANNACSLLFVVTALTGETGEMVTVPVQQGDVAVFEFAAYQGAPISRYVPKPGSSGGNVTWTVTYPNYHWKYIATAAYYDIKQNNLTHDNFGSDVELGD